MTQHHALGSIVVRHHDAAIAFYVGTLGDYRAYVERGVVFVRGPVEEPYGTVAVFRDVCGNLWDLLEPRS